MIKKDMLQRPNNFVLNNQSPLAIALVFAGLGKGCGSLTMRDSSPRKNNGTLKNFTTGYGWNWAPVLRRWSTEHVEANPNQHVAIIEINLGTTHTIAIWANANYDGNLLGAATDGVGDSLVSLNGSGAAGYTAQGWGATSYSGLTIPSGWYHLCVTRVPNSWKLYINGIAQAAQSMSGTTRVFKLATIGGSTPAAWTGWQGNLSDPMAWKRLLSTGEIRALADPDNIDLRIGNTPLILPPRRLLFPSAIASPQIISGSTVWGHSTGVTETNIRTFQDNWTGDGTISGTGDNEQISLEEGQTMESEVVNTGVTQVTLLKNQYGGVTVSTWGTRRSKQKMLQRPETFTLNTASPLARRLVFAGLGIGCRSLKMWDSSLNRNHGTFGVSTAAPKWAWSQSLRRFVTVYDASNDVTNLPAVFGTLNSGNAWTILAWIKPKAYTVYNNFINAQGTGIVQTKSTKFGLLRRITSSHCVRQCSNSTINAGMWTHITARVNGADSTNNSTLADANSYLYLNGSLDIGAFVADADYPETNTIGLGYSAANASIGDVLIYSRSLTLGEIRCIADPANIDLRIGNVPLILPPRRTIFPAAVAGSEATLQYKTSASSDFSIASSTPTIRPVKQKISQRPETFTLNTASPLARGLVFAGLGIGCRSLKMWDSSLNRNHGTFGASTAAPTWEWSARLCRSMVKFDGSNDVIDCGKNSSIKPTVNGTWATWVRMPSSMYGYAFGDMGGNGNRGTQLQMSSSTSITTQISSDSTTTFGGATTVVSLLTLSHLAFRFLANYGIDVFQNGKLINSFTTSPPANIYKNGYNFYIGNRGDLSVYLAASLADPCVWSRALSTGEIRALADPSNIDLRIGNVPLILHPKRTMFPSAGSGSTWIDYVSPFTSLGYVKARVVG